MILPPEMFPMGESIRDAVVQRFAHPESLLRGAQLMDRAELAEYLRSYTDYSQSPLDAVLRAVEETGDPALPPPQESAMLGWLGAAFELWEREFPLDRALTERLRELKPLLARLALSDPGFTTPGAHPLHRLLDALHDAALGWQPDLGRTGEAVEKLIEETRDALLEENPLGGNRQLALQVAASTEAAKRLYTRGQRMGQRAGDVERARLRSTRARATAAATINQVLASNALPDAAGAFLRGPWFESAQLVLLRFDASDSEWQQMQAAMANLVEALTSSRVPDSENAEASASAICRGLETYLLSLQHQPDAVQHELGELEYLLLRALSGQSVACSEQAAIETARSESATAQQELPESVRPGEWLLLQLSRNEQVRMQVVLRQDAQQRVLLCRHSGQQQRSFGFAELGKLIADGAVRFLPAGATFSRALASAAGVTPEQAKPAPAPRERGAAGAAAASAQSTSAPGAAASADEQVAGGAALPLPPLGTWLGFHDVDPPLLAKLAMHDAVRRLIIFVNRQGRELRRLGEAEYLALIQEGQVDILQARSNFREEVERARRRLQRHSD